MASEMNMKKDKTTFLTIHRRIILVFILSSVFAILLVGSALNYVLKKTTMDSWKQKQEFVTLEFAPQSAIPASLERPNISGT